jgi:hypothetical protein
MNCKPGDFAYIYRTDGDGLAREIGAACLDRFVVVKYLRPPVATNNCLSGLVWEIAEPFHVQVRGVWYKIIGIEDHCLRPIRDPGEDAQDETLQWLDVPSAEKVDA